MSQVRVYPRVSHGFSHGYGYGYENADLAKTRTRYGNVRGTTKYGESRVTSLPRFHHHFKAMQSKYSNLSLVLQVLYKGEYTIIIQITNYAFTVRFQRQKPSTGQIHTNQASARARIHVYVQRQQQHRRPQK
jgi:hypothetical protein